MDHSETDTSPPPLPKAGRSKLMWWIHMLVIGSYPLVLGILGFLASDMEAGPALGSNAQGLIKMSLVELSIFGVIFAIGWSASRASVEDLYLKWRMKFWTPLLGAGYSVALRLGVGIVVASVVGIYIFASGADPDELEKILKPDIGKMVDFDALSNDPLYLFLNVTLISFVVAGFREELWRAGFLAAAKHLFPEKFSSRKGQILAALLASVVFGLGHLTMGWSAVFMTGLLGFGLGVIMVMHRSIWEAVIAHGCFNATTFLLLPLIQKYYPDMLG